MPRVDFDKYRIRRNPYAARIAREGIELVHEGPSAASLAEIPEPDFSVARILRNKYAARAAESAASLQYGRGRPRAGSEVGPTTTRSLRLPESIWQALEEEAKQSNTTVHGLLREIVAKHVMRPPRH